MDELRAICSPKMAFTNFTVFSKLCIPQIATFVFGEGNLAVKFWRQGRASS